jgi:hypothetical protein
MDSMIEWWLPIPGYPHHEASNLGRIRSLTHYEHTRNRWGPMQRIRRGKVLSQTLRGKYLAVSIENYPQSVHRLVCMAFHDRPSNGLEVNHLDGNRYNNQADNLEWTTRSKNELHAYRALGKEAWNKGSKYPCRLGKYRRKLSHLAKCEAILEEHESTGMSKSELAQKHGLTRRSIHERIKAALAERNRDEPTADYWRRHFFGEGDTGE